MNPLLLSVVLEILRADPMNNLMMLSHRDDYNISVQMFSMKKWKIKIYLLLISDVIFCN